jgi:hypothetical protein
VDEGCRVEAIRRAAERRRERPARSRCGAQTVGGYPLAKVAGVLVRDDERVARIDREHVTSNSRRREITV